MELDSSLKPLYESVNESLRAIHHMVDLAPCSIHNTIRKFIEETWPPRGKIGSSEYADECQCVCLWRVKCHIECWSSYKIRIFIHTSIGEYKCNVFVNDWEVWRSGQKIWINHPATIFSELLPATIAKELGFALIQEIQRIITRLELEIETLIHNTLCEQDKDELNSLFKKAWELQKQLTKNYKRVGDMRHCAKEVQGKIEEVIRKLNMSKKFAKSRLLEEARVDTEDVAKIIYTIINQ